LIEKLTLPISDLLINGKVKKCEIDYWIMFKYISESIELK